MEVFADEWGLTVIIDIGKGELGALEKGTLESEILLVNHKEPYHKTTGKKLTLGINLSIREIEVESFPEEAGWEEIERVEVRISPKEYDDICYVRGRVIGTRPRLYTDIMIQDSNATP